MEAGPTGEGRLSAPQLGGPGLGWVPEGAPMLSARGTYGGPMGAMGGIAEEGEEGAEGGGSPRHGPQGSGVQGHGRGGMQRERSAQLTADEVGSGGAGADRLHPIPVWLGPVELPCHALCRHGLTGARVPATHQLASRASLRVSRPPHSHSPSTQQPAQPQPPLSPPPPPPYPPPSPPPPPPPPYHLHFHHRCGDSVIDRVV